ncbi:MAG: uroporphyrinogen decarboxylase family protein [Deltaproteobacteria bacterium]|nr:uroporphyrinogen decarboxylase family protein [Deltaproteobacteria bacterium]
MHLRQDHMTSRERMDALWQYRKPDRVPLAALGTGFNTKNTGHSVADAYDDPEKSFFAMVWTAEQYGWDPIPQLSGHAVLGAKDFGGEVRLPQGEYEGALVVKSYPVQTEDDIENLQMPDPKTAGRIPKAMRLAKLQYENNLPVYFFSRSPFTMAANICGLNRFCRWILKKPELCERLMRLTIDHIFNVLEYWVETFGPEKVFAWMSSPSESNQVISPKQMEKFALPYHYEYHERLKALGINRFGFHICGDQNLNMPCLAEAPPWSHPSVLSFGHEVDIEEAGKYFPEDIIFGNIAPAVIQTGTPQQVYELCKIAIEKGKKAPGGFILGPGCGLPVAAPPVNVYAMTKAVHDFGWYV